MTPAHAPHAAAVHDDARMRSFLLRVEQVAMPAPAVRYVVLDLRTGERRTFDSAAPLHDFLDALGGAGLR
jgi:hypothetical protein